MKLPFKQVDVFTSVPFKGNPVAVVFDADELTIEQMQKIANWTNLSETTFIKSSTRGDYFLSIFTPKSELPFAGHPTVGSAFAVYEAGIIPKNKKSFIQECKAGLIDLCVENDIIFAKVPKLKMLDLKIDSMQFCSVHGSNEFENPIAINAGPIWVVARVKDLSSLQSIAIDVDKTVKLSEELNVTGTTVYCIVKGEGVYVRSFAPIINIFEDPVCGSGNAAVALHIKRTGLRDLVGDNYTAFQGHAMGRSGIIKVKYDGDDIIIGGNAVTAVNGTITL